ncbi:MAG: HNH endonuclease [Nitrososphaeria archaeon]
MCLHTSEREGGLWLGGRGTRLTPAQKRRIKDFCIKRDGSRCMICGREEKDAWNNLQIDHKDGNAGNHLASNLQLAHQRCNTMQWNKMFQNRQQVSCQPKREIGVLAPSPEYQPTSPEVVLNMEYEPVFRRFCFAKAKEAKLNGPTVSRTDLRILARNYVGCSLQTAYSYMERLFAPNGPFVEKNDYCTGLLYVDFRDPKDINLGLNELEAKYPKEGQRKSSCEQLDVKRWR